MNLRGVSAVGLLITVVLVGSVSFVVYHTYQLRRAEQNKDILISQPEVPKVSNINSVQDLTTTADTLGSLDFDIFTSESQKFDKDSQF